MPSALLRLTRLPLRDAHSRNFKPVARRAVPPRAVHTPDKVQFIRVGVKIFIDRVVQVLGRSIPDESA